MTPDITSLLQDLRTQIYDLVLYMEHDTLSGIIVWLLIESLIGAVLHFTKPFPKIHAFAQALFVAIGVLFLVAVFMLLNRLLTEIGTFAPQ